MAAFLLAGCEAAPWPDAALLKPQPPPKCAAKADAGAAAPDAAGDPAAKLRKLDYEAQCYRHAEMIARSPNRWHLAQPVALDATLIVR